MISKPSVIPLDVKQDIYALLDEGGNTIGTGTEEVCTMLLYLLDKSQSAPIARATPHRANLRSAISI